MKAIVHERYGSPDTLELRDVDVPVPRGDQLLVRVHASSLSASDWEVVRGRPLYSRYGGLRRPASPIPGTDVAGTVEAVGDAVTGFRPGDEVLADTMFRGAGAFAEYVCVSQAAPIATKPAGMSFAQAATLPQAGMIAWQWFHGGDGVPPGSRVLVNGAGGGAGTLAVQLAKRAGAHVTAVDNGHKQDLMRLLGTDRVVDYTRQDVTKLDGSYDAVLDLAGFRSPFAYRRVLAEGGRYDVVGGSTAALLEAAALGPLVSRLIKKRIRLLIVHPNSEDLRSMVDLVVAGEVRPVIERSYPLEKVPEALRHLGAGRALGKVVIAVTPDGRP